MDSPLASLREPSSTSPLGASSSAANGGDSLKIFRKAVTRITAIGVLGRQPMGPVLAWRHEDRLSLSTVWDSAFSRDGKTLVSSCGPDVMVFDAADGRQLHRMRGHKSAVRAVACCGETQRAASASQDKQVIVWNLELGQGLAQFWLEHDVRGISFSPEAVLACATTQDVSFWSDAAERTSTFKISGEASCCAWSADATRLALGLKDGTVLLRAPDGREKARFKGEGDDAVCSVIWNPNADGGSNTRGGRRSEPWHLCVASVNGVIVFHHFDPRGEREEVRSLSISLMRSIAAVDLLPKSGHVIIVPVQGDNEAWVHIYNETTKLCELPVRIVGLCTQASQNLISFACERGQLHVYKLVSGAG